MKKLMLILALTAPMAASAEILTNPSRVDFINNSPSMSQAFQRTPENIKQQKMNAIRVMTEFCSRQISSLVFSSAMFFDQKIDLDDQAGINQAGWHMERFLQDIDDFIKRCGWMLE